jgi:hypothetical protein
VSDACHTCAEHAAAVPVEVQLKRLIAEDYDDAREMFAPVAVTAAQVAATEQLTAALFAYLKAFGYRNLGARLGLWAWFFRSEGKRRAIHGRILAARREINDEAARLAREGDDAAARAHQLTTPTPDYPGKDRDFAWLREHGHGV